MLCKHEREAKRNGTYGSLWEEHPCTCLEARVATTAVVVVVFPVAAAYSFLTWAGNTLDRVLEK